MNSLYAKFDAFRNQSNNEPRDCIPERMFYIFCRPCLYYFPLLLTAAIYKFKSNRTEQDSSRCGCTVPSSCVSLSETWYAKLHSEHRKETNWSCPIRLSEVWSILTIFEEVPYVSNGQAVWSRSLGVGITSSDPPPAVNFSAWWPSAGCCPLL